MISNIRTLNTNSSTSSLDNTICEDDLKLFLSNDYIPCSTTTFFLWRVFSVPIFTALDSIEVFKLFFNSEYLWGATSSIISIFTLQEKIYFERLEYLNLNGDKI